MTLTSTLEVELAVVPDATYPRTVVALPPSDADPVWDEMRVFVGGVLIYRAFDPGDVIVTGGPISLVSMSGEPLVTMAGEALVSMGEP